MVASVAFALSLQNCRQLIALLWVLLGTLGGSVSLDTNSVSMPHMYELDFETPGDKV